MSESQARLDAMVDARTLLETGALWRVAVAGAVTVSHLHARHWLMAHRCAIRAAHVAFEAVPALKCALLLLALTFAVPAHAGRVESVSLWCGAKAADLISTERALGRGGYESNPLMRDRGVRIAAGVGSCVVAAEVDHRLRKHRKSRLALRVVGVGLMVFAVQKNERTAR